MAWIAALSAQVPSLLIKPWSLLVRSTSWEKRLRLRHYFLVKKIWNARADLRWWRHFNQVRRHACQIEGTPHFLTAIHYSRCWAAMKVLAPRIRRGRSERTLIKLSIVWVKWVHALGVCHWGSFFWVDLNSSRRLSDHSRQVIDPGLNSVTLNYLPDRRGGQVIGLINFRAQIFLRLLSLRAAALSPLINRRMQIGVLESLLRMRGYLRLVWNSCGRACLCHYKYTRL